MSTKTSIRCLSIVAAIAALSLSPTVTAQTNVTGAWSNPQDGGAGSVYCLRTYDVGNEAVISYGSFALLDDEPPHITNWTDRCNATGNVSDDPGNEGQSGLGFEGETNVDFSTWVPSVPSQLGQFTHYNGRIETPENDDYLTGATLTISLNGGGLSDDFQFDVTYEETPNFANPCAYTETNGLCDDRVAFANLTDNGNTVQIGLNIYTLVIEGFGECGVGPNPGDVEFITVERTKNTTCLWGSLEPSTTLPVEFTAFEAVARDGNVDLKWSVESETSNAGFAVEHAKPRDSFREIGFVEGAGTTSQVRTYAFRADEIPPGTHRFRLRQIDLDGSSSYSKEIEVAVDVPGRMMLYPAYPNPFNPQTTIQFAVAEAQPVSIMLFNTMGRPVRELYSGVPEGGNTQPITIDGSGLTSGSYVVRMIADGHVTSQRITLLK